MIKKEFPVKQGLYDPINEHDACGIGLYANIKGNSSHETVENGLEMLRNMEHRGGQGSDPDTGDGAGIMLQIPHEYFKQKCDFALPASQEYGIGMLFLPVEDSKRRYCEHIVEETIQNEGLQLLGWRDVPVNPTVIGESAQITQPFIRQVFIGKENSTSIDEFERKLYLVRKISEKRVAETEEIGTATFYFASLSNQTIVYKGMVTPEQVDDFYLDLSDPNFKSAFALVHSRFSTNTFPSWERAHPNRFLIHNGEINTLRGNVNWMLSREKMISSELFGDDISKITPIVNSDGSDSSMLDNALEFLTMAGYSLPHAAMMMIPEAWDKDDTMTDPKKAFYEYHSCLMEPWDGPTSIVFTDGRKIGAMLDRNGLRPARYYVTSDDHIIYASEAGVLEVPEENIIEKGRLAPGKMLFIDLEQGRIVPDDEVKEQVATEKPYRDWLEENLIQLNEIEEIDQAEIMKEERQLFKKQVAYGYTYEELTKNIAPMVTEGKDPVGSMGNDVPLAVLSNRPQLLFNYFKQLFAQVTNPPIDAIREESVTSTMTLLGAEHNLLNPGPEHSRRIRLETPIISNTELAGIKSLPLKAFQTKTLPILFDAAKGETELEIALHKLFKKADQAIEAGNKLLVLSDREMDEQYASIPVLLAVSGLHHHLVNNGSRSKVSIIVETGEARDVHHFAMLIGYGADAINPYLGIATINEMIKQELIPEMPLETAVRKYIAAATNGIVKVLSKMGISTIQSYRGAQIFEAIGVDQSVIDKYFTRTSSQIGGIKLDTIAKETLLRHKQGFNDHQYKDHVLDAGGELQWRSNGEYHAFNPKTIHTLQHAARRNDYSLYKRYSEMANTEQLAFIRNAFEFKKDREPVSIDEVESVESILKRFKTGAMSYGALSEEAHETLAIAMNRIGGKSNSGEGGEDPGRFTPDENGDLRRSAIKQVASGRFGVSSHYLTNADEIQIKMAQGAKPGEGGQLPGKKVYPWIAEVRGSTPGVGLISPPPHHDIYSIEDLAQLIHDLKNANPSAKISVKLVAKAGVGTIAAGVAKGLADKILISGYEGGTGAAARTSIKHAGLPWELGLAETHQTLLLNDLRDRVMIEADGKLMTGRDVIMASLLGAEEFGFSTAPLVVLGCVLMRACHLDTCPVGIATQNPELRKKYIGDPQHVVNYLTFIAQEVRELMAELGFKTINEMVGRTDILEVSERTKTHWKAKDLDLSSLLYQPKLPENVGRYCTKEQDHKLDQSLDMKALLPYSRPALEEQKAVKGSFKISNTNRVTGTILGHEITKRYGAEGLPEDTINFEFKGSAGQSFGAFVPKGVTLNLKGDANDYVGKGLSGGKIIVQPSEGTSIVPEQSTIIGNVSFFGSTSGEAYIRGLAGERFCVRNSGVKAVVEGIGDNGCEYMTGGRAIILGNVGKNFAAGMSGGIAYVLAESPEQFKQSCNKEMIAFEPLDNYEEIVEVKKMIQKHADYTNSLKANYILHNWNDIVPQFVKVIPKEFRRVKESIDKMEQQGYRPEEAAMHVFQQNKKENLQTTKSSNLEPV
ncbi:glutamate synthase large subunit [Pseudalkalibacillus caeni]|uniref:Glutamate synthase large subunit n=1 Tax=Exobacillus caeni TaxID=2574798 RepID=A0A5R9EWK2_9BACL|nr:glutamate synthase large subunit [Pseudalkalibacillus caeni]TLS35427.1 glutamate synthase large subunit [Pseudalkalibacillus caeni]